ncbi:hypothetical protein F5B19DRAFT_480704 [Rostrohypoxylon terebratum]|nr:hypothetical protein F5B19DRAFT_480704 [Rostrohypoxylon terebratum]
MIDGLNLATISHEVTRSRLAIVPQYPLILFGTVRFNIDPLSAHSNADVINALERVRPVVGNPNLGGLRC